MSLLERPIQEENRKNASMLETIANARRKSEAKRNIKSSNSSGDTAPKMDVLTKISFQNASLKDDIMSMEAPIFSLSKIIDTEIRTWTSANGLSTVTLIPSVLGRPTMWDKDILIYVFSCLILLKNEGLAISRTLEFHAYDYFLATDKSTGGDSYKSLEEGLDKLVGFQLKTNIKTNKILITESFSLIENYKLIKNAKSLKTDRVVVTLSEWLFNCLQGFNVLTIDSNYFKLTKPVEKRLYEIARKHVGSKATWDLSFDLLLEKVGSDATRKEFSRMLRQVIDSDKIPTYRLRFLKTGSVQFYQKDIKKFIDASNNKK